VKIPSRHQIRRRLLREQVDFEDGQNVLIQWFESPLGRTVLEAEQALINPYLSRLFGYHILQIGCSSRHSLISDSPVGHKILFAPEYDKVSRLPVADNEQLPLAKESIDVVVIHHALDFTRDSHSLLREATRVLRPGGHLLIVGFNPFSLWGVKKLLKIKAEVPWAGRFISHRRVADWLKLLELQVEKVDYGLHFLPSRWRKAMNSSGGVDVLSERLTSPFGGAYLIVGTKQVLPLTPVMQKWRPLRPRATVMPAAENIRIKKLH
jgi:SAM-dependent methyltransferase